LKENKILSKGEYEKYKNKWKVYTLIGKKHVMK
jgi:hypothetical protein